MTRKLLLVTGALSGSIAAGVALGPRAWPGRAPDGDAVAIVKLAMAGCAGGYSADARGDCQPDNGYVDSRCQVGFQATPFPNGNGYRCIENPRGC